MVSKLFYSLCQYETLSQGMEKKKMCAGFQLSALQFTSCSHVAVTNLTNDVRILCPFSLYCLDSFLLDDMDEKFITNCLVSPSSMTQSFTHLRTRIKKILYGIFESTLGVSKGQKETEKLFQGANRREKKVPGLYHVCLICR